MTAPCACPHKIPAIDLTLVGSPPCVPPPGTSLKKLSLVSEKEVNTVKVATCVGGVFHD